MEKKPWIHLPSLFFVGGLVDFPEDVGQNAIGPVPCGGIEDAVQFDDTHGFGVQDVELGQQA